MYYAEGPWGTPQVEELFQRHMQQYQKAQILARYIACSRAWIAGFTNDDGTTTPASEGLTMALSAEQWLYPSLIPLAGDRDKVVLHKVNTHNGVILPGSDQWIGTIESENSVLPEDHFGGDQVKVILGALIEIQDFGLKAVSDSGTRQY